MLLLLVLATPSHFVTTIQEEIRILGAFLHRAKTFCQNTTRPRVVAIEMILTLA